MNIQNTMKQFKSLSEEQQKKVQEFMEFLENEKDKSTSMNIYPKAGFLKGAMRIHDDFDDPISDMEEYQ